MNRIGNFSHVQQKVSGFPSFKYATITDLRDNNLLIQRIIGKIQSDKIVKKAIDYRCEVLHDENNPVGVIAYKKTVQNKDQCDSFVAKIFFSYRSNSTSQDNYAKALFDRTMLLARRGCAKAIVVKVYDKFLSSYFLQNQFNRVKKEEELKKGALKCTLCFHLLKTHNVAQGAVEKAPMKSKTEGERDKVIIPKRPYSQVKEHRLPMKGTLYFDYIMQGKKKFEGRVNGAACQKMRVGDMLRMFDRSANWGIVCEITSIDTYSNFREMLNDKGVLHLLPQLENFAKKSSASQLIEEGVKIYHSFPLSDRVKLGCDI